MNLLNRLFGSKADEPKIVPTLDPSDVSEPVRAIIAALKARPHTFGISKVPAASIYVTKYRFLDRVTGLTATVTMAHGASCHLTLTMPFALTSTEKRLLVAAGNDWLDHRELRRGPIIARRNRRQRRQWADAYGVTA